jgi:S-adenosylmethionine:tRNA ribosyltransferase-isomerase
LDIADFNYYLPPELIAQQPAVGRDTSRLLAVSRSTAEFIDREFRDLPTLLRAGDCLVLNDTRVFPARLKGYRYKSSFSSTASGAVEIFLLQQESGDTWEALVKPGRSLRPGTIVTIGNPDVAAELLVTVVDWRAQGRRVVRLESQTGESLETLIDRLGTTPLPPYIKREADSLRLDTADYQTIYAQHRGSVAAPTAGLHFTPAILAKIQAQEVAVAKITHHVGYGTFQPVRVNDITTHQIAAENYQITPAAADLINERRQQGGRIIAVGTTTTRALESATVEGKVVASQATTALYIYPGYQFRIVDALLTNFHLPQSSLLMLVAAFAGKEFILSAYRHAVAARYRFYSYGDCMFIA